MAEKSPQDEIRGRMSTMARERAGRLVNPSVAEMIHARKGNKAQKRDAMRNILCRGEPTDGITSRIGRLRRLRRKSRSR